jgi:hypothetical protein
VGKSYSEILMAYDTSAVIGLLQEGRVHLNPAPETRLQSGGGVILITEDDDTARLSGITRPALATQLILNGTLPPASPERTLILGWNAKVISMLQQLDQYVAEGSATMVVANFPDGEAEIASHCAHLSRQTIHYQVGNPTERSLLDQLQVNEYHHVIVLCSDYLTPEEADAQTLVTLLQLRDIENHAITSSPNGHGAFPIVTEVLDSRNQALVQVTQPDDFVISEQIISRMLAQVAEQKSLNTVFNKLFSPEGAEIYLKPATNYVASHEPVNFYTVVEAAKRQGETAIGYRRDADAGNVARAYGVVLNPPKENLVNFNTGDRIIVLAEN